jgi:hypothetical protein
MLKKVTKRILKILLWIIVSFVALDLLIVTLIMVPPIQQFVVLKTSKILTNITGGEITVDKIYLSPTLTLTAKNFAIKDHHYENMIFATTLKGKINLSKTGKGQVCLSFAELDDGEVVIRKYAEEDTVNISLWAQGFKKEERKSSGFKLLFENINLNNVRFVYINDDKRLYKEDNTIDYAFFELQHINLNVDNFLVTGPDISCKINALTLSQHTGFEISSFSSNFRIYAQGLLLDSLCFTTPNSSFNGDFAFQYNDFKDYSDFLNLINFDTKIKNASVAMTDVIYFAPTLAGMENHFIVSGYVGGVVNHIQTKDIYLKFKQQTNFAGDFALADVLDAKNRSFDVVFRDANISFAELAQFKLPKGKTIQLPEEIKDLTHARIKGRYKGSFKKFDTDLAVQTNLGSLTAKLNAAPRDSALCFSGAVACHNLELGKITQQPEFFNEASLHTTLEGSATQYDSIAAFIASVSLKLQGAVTGIDLCGYELKNVNFKGNYKQQNANLALESADLLAAFAAKGNINFAKETPVIDAVLTNANIKLHQLFSHYPRKIDTLTEKGFEKFILKMQQTPNLLFTVDSLEIDMRGNRLDNFNGFAAVNYAKLTNGEETSRIDWLRLNAINIPNFPHQYILHSNAVNISFKTNYDYEDCIATLGNVAAYYLPEMFKKNPDELKEVTSIEPEAFIDFDLQFYYTQPLFNMLLPRLSIARNSSANIHIGKTRDKDVIDLLIPQIRYAGLGKLNNLTLTGRMDTERFMKLQLYCDSVTMYRKKDGAITFANIDLNTRSKQQEIQFEAFWRNPKGISINEKNHFEGILFGDRFLRPSLKIIDATLFVRESAWQFVGNNNIIVFDDKNLIFNQCVLASDVGTVSINGELSKQTDKECNILLENFDVSLLNSLTEKQRMSFGGDMSLMATLTGMEDHYGIAGKSFVKNFVFNEELLGNLFLDAIIPEGGDPCFKGGILSDEQLLEPDIAKFSYADYLALPNRIIELTGKWDTKAKDLRVHADMDILQLGFLAPFLNSFSNIVSGDAAGALDFIMTPDSLYFDGKVIVKKAQLGIAPLNTVYNLTNQEILFNPQGIIFNQVLVKDKFNNEATLSGYIHHNKFKDFKIDLNIVTNKIMALNTPPKMDAPFFGDGFVSGEIAIQGDTKQLNFTSQNIKTLPGSAITFPITSASSVSSSKGIYFVSTNTKTEKTTEETNDFATILNFDFIFDITRDADVKLELDPIDGVLKCKTNGRLHLLYNTNTDDMDLDGILSIVSGKFNMSLKNFIPKDFTIVEGGTIAFAGGLTSAQINVSALYQKTTSLNSLNSNLGIGRTDVAAYLKLTGNLMNPNPSFSFEFPRLTDKEHLEVFAALDTANQQNGIRQFFSFVFLNTFINSESNINANQSPIGVGTGVDLVTNILNSFLSGQLRNVDFGVNYSEDTRNNYDEKNNYREYSFNAGVNLYNDKVMLKTNLGLGYEKTGESNNYSFVGDVLLDFPINENWNINLFYFNDQTTNIDISKPQQGGGVSLKYRQDFNNRKDFMESWKVKKREKNK